MSHTSKKAKAWPDVVGFLLIYLMTGCILFWPALPLVLRFLETDFWLLIFRQLNLDLNSTFNYILSFMLSLVLYIHGTRDLVHLLFWAFGLILSTEKYLETIKYFTKRKKITFTGNKSYILLLVMYV